MKTGDNEARVIRREGFMNKIGLVLSLDKLDAPLANHFGMAKWLLIYGMSRN